MRSRHVVTAVPLLAILATAAPPLGGQVPRPVQIGLGAGLTLLTGEDRDFWNDGFHAQGTVTVNLPTLPIGLRAEVAYHRVGSKDRSTGSADTLVLGDLSVVAGIASVVYHFSPPASPVRPYVLVGAGLFRTEADAVLYGTSVSGSSTDFGMALGVGARFGRLFAEGRLLNIFGDGDSAQLYPLTVGVVF